jgi:small redox-active disulfide protein 2
MEIKVLGPGCANCKKLVESVNQAISELGIEANVQKVEDITEIMSYGVMSTPGLVVDGVVKSSGRALSVGQVKEILKG